MFNDKRYTQVNREERFYCALFGHALLASRICRRNLAEIASRRFQVQLDADQLEVYLEVAALRDYWNDLGDPNKYSPKTHASRRAVVESILELMSVDSSVIDSEPVFWTAGLNSKLWSPGRWNLDKLKDAGLKVLKPVRWAFNAKPDILLFSPCGALTLEAKVESNEGRDETVGYDQLEVQKLIVFLWSKLIPSFNGVPISLRTLKLRGSAGADLTWDDVLSVVSEAEIDDFTIECLSSLRRYGECEVA